MSVGARRGRHGSPPEEQPEPQKVATARAHWEPNHCSHKTAHTATVVLIRSRFMSAESEGCPGDGDGQERSWGEREGEREGEAESGEGSHDQQSSRELSQSSRELQESQRIHSPPTASVGIEPHKALELHEEIVKAMLEKNVDPFERSYRLSDDPVILDVTRRDPQLLQGTISLKYWRDFSSNRKYLETRSAQKSNLSASASASATRDRLKKKETQLKAQKRPKKQRQDVRQPSAQITYSFAAPPSGFPLFDSHIIGPKNPVQKLLEDRNLEKASESRENAEAIPSPSSPAVRTASAKRPMKPLVTVSGDVGTPLPGGIMSQGRAREAQQVPITASIPFPSGRELDGGKKKAVGGPFLSSVRFPSVSPLAKSTSPQPTETNLGFRSDGYRGRFSNNPRFQQSHLESNTPDPGCYQVCDSLHLSSISHPILVTDASSLR